MKKTTNILPRPAAPEAGGTNESPALVQVSEALLGVEINAAHDRCVRSAEETTLWAAIVGLELIARKATLKHKQWLPWLENNAKFGRRTATNYMQVGRKALEAFDYPPAIPEEMRLSACVGRIIELLDDPEQKSERLALLGAIRPEKKPAPAEPKPKKRSAPRPSGPRPLTIKAAPNLAHKIAQRVQLSEPTVKTAFFKELRPDFEAWLAEQAQAA